MLHMRSRSLVSSPDGLFWYPDPDGGGAPPPAGATPPPAGTPPPTGTTPPPAAAAGTPPPSKYTYDEDRSNWVRPDVFKNAERLNNKTAGEIENLRRQLLDRDRRIAALAGVAPVDPDQAEAEKVANAFYSLPQFAHLRNVTPELLDRMSKLVHESTSLTEARDHIYNQQADRLLTSIDRAFAEEIGAESLTPGQQRKLRAAFAAWIPDRQTDPEGHAAFDKRYNAGDETLITEFLKEFATDVLEPARRQATIPVAQRRPIPRSGGGGPVTSQPQKPDYSKMSVGEMLDAAEKDAERVGR